MFGAVNETDKPNYLPFCTIFLFTVFKRTVRISTIKILHYKTEAYLKAILHDTLNSILFTEASILLSLNPKSYDKNIS